MDLFDLTGKVAVVTGGTRGIGLMMARGLLQAGARVYLSARKADEGSAVRLMWESDTDVLLDYIVAGSWDHFLRCSVLTRRCERAPTPQDA